MGLTVSVYKELHRFAVNARFTCPAGKLTAMVGPSGAGKTTLIRLIAGLETPDEGTIALDGEVFTDTDSGRFLPAYRRGVGLVFQEYPLFPHMTVRENILYGAPRGYDPGQLMDTFRIRRLADRRPGSISGGERQRTAFCQALARQPRLLLLDEPFSALDQETRTFLCASLARMKGELNIPILHVTHDLGEAHRLADEVIALDEGQIAMDWLARQHVPGRTVQAVTATLS